MDVLPVLCACLFSFASALPVARWREFPNQMPNPNVFMDPSFSVGGQGTSQTQDSSMMQAMALKLVQNQAQGNQANAKQTLSQPQMGSNVSVGKASQNQAQTGAVQSQDQKQPGIPSQTATLTNGQPSRQSGSKFQVDSASSSGSGSSSGSNSNSNSNSNLAKSPNVGTPNRPGTQIIVTGTKTAGTSLNANDNSNSNVAVLQQTVSGSSLFNPGNTNTVVQGPPGTVLSQFNNNMGGRNSLLNSFGMNGVSVDASVFAKPKQNADGSISGAAGNANGPPIMGPGFMQMQNTNGQQSQSGNSQSQSQNSNDYNSMFGPPNFFMNPGSSFGQK